MRLHMTFQICYLFKRFVAQGTVIQRLSRGNAMPFELMTAQHFL